MLEGHYHLENEAPDNSRKHHPRRSPLLATPWLNTSLSIPQLQLTGIVLMCSILERPRTIMDAPESAALQLVLDSADRMRVFLLKESLPLLLEVAGEDLREEEVR